VVLVHHVPVGIVGWFVGAAAAVQPVKLTEGLLTEPAPLQLTTGAVLVQEVVCGGHVLVEAVGTGPRVTDESEEKVVLPYGRNLLRGLEALPV